MGPKAARPGWIVGVAALLALVAVIAIWTSREGGDTGRATMSSEPTGDPDGDPRAQCKVLALAALEMLARGDYSVLAELETGHNPSTEFIVGVVRRHRTAFLAAARGGDTAHARRVLTPTVSADCRHAP